MRVGMRQFLCKSQYGASIPEADRSYRSDGLLSNYMPMQLYLFLFASRSNEGTWSSVEEVWSLRASLLPEPAQAFVGHGQDSPSC